MRRIETDGSVWLIDEGTMRYCRFPKTEAGRELPEWGDERAGVLQDLIWHGMTRWAITEPKYYDLGAPDEPWFVMMVPPRLIIEGPDGSLTAPNPKVLA